MTIGKLYLLLLLSQIPSIFTVVVHYSCNKKSPCGCATQPATVGKIVGGETVRRISWPWVVSLSIPIKLLCGGTIISESWIITAAHCVQGVSISRITVYAGSNRRWAGKQQRQVLRKIIHPDYDSTLYTHDIALLELKEPLDLTDQDIKPICLISNLLKSWRNVEWPLINASVVAVGWGRLSETGPSSTLLQQVTLRSIDRHESHCKSIIADPKVQFCAADDNKDTCQGDSGGPLMVFNTKRQWVLVGITSYGIGCAQKEYAGIYTRVAAYDGWIQQHTNGAYFKTVPLTYRSKANSIFSIEKLSLFFFFIQFQSIFL